MLIAELFGGLNEDDEDSEEDSGERGLLRLLVGGQHIRRGRLHRLLLAQLLRGSDDLGDDDEDDDDSGIGGRKMLGLLLGRRALQRGRLRRILLAELIRRRNDDNGDDGDEERPMRRRGTMRKYGLSQLFSN